VTNLIDDLTEAILESFRGISGVQTSEIHPDDLTGLVFPAVLLKENFIELAPSDGTDRLALELNYLAEVVVRRTKSTAEKDARNLAISLLHNINQAGSRGLSGVENPEILQAEPDPFKEQGRGKKDQGYVVWSVEWKHIVYLGESIWDEDGKVTEILVGTSPKVGPDHIEDYTSFLP